jgi:2OG-Fe(II) oxygenase superfamily
VTPGFHWTTFDLTTQLPQGWQQELADAAASADFREYPRTPILTRESAGVRSIARGRVHAADVRERLPWLYESYRGYFLELARQASAEPVIAAVDDRYGIVLNVQRGTRMRFECHVDSNPLTGLLFCTDHHTGAGGELVFAHDPAVADIAAVERACSVIRPQAGHLIFFDGRKHPHYARPLTKESHVRIVAVMNFYTMSCPESTRPLELNRHLFQQALRARSHPVRRARMSVASRPQFR